MANSTSYDFVTETIIKALEAGTVVWQKPWTSRKPCNAVTGKSYRGINPFLLMLGGATYADHRWLTFKQAQEMGGTVRKGEKGTWIVFSSPSIKKDDAGAVVSKYWIMRSYTVFNVEQCDGLTKLPALQADNTETDPNVVAEEVWAKYTDAPKITWGDLAAYAPSLDTIIMPRRETFKDNASFYGTLYHEGAHSTGHTSRLNRKSVMESDGFGNEVYSLEELIAEFTAAFMCAEAGIDVPNRENTVAYLQNWIEKLKADKTLVVKAASAAQSAADYMLGIRHETTETEAEPDKVLATA